MAANDVATKAYETIGKIEEIRMRSGRLQEALSGQMKRSLEALKDMVTSLTEKANEKGDIEHVRRQNIELARENANVRGEMDY